MTTKTNKDRIGSLYSLQWIIVIIVCQSLFSQNLKGQEHITNPIDHDTNYYHSYTNLLTSRLYSSVKYANFTLHDRNLGQSLNYKINNRIMLGFGANYSIFGLNIAFNLPFNEWDQEKYGITEYLDLQSHLYLRRYIIDFYLQRYRGFYLDNPANAISGWDDSEHFPLRPDLRVIHAGLNVQYIFNSRRFSYRAAYIQNEWQKKSAGSLIVGASAFYILEKGDSSLIPTNVIPPDFAMGAKFDQLNQISIGLNLGYSYTLVLKKHFFLVLGVNAGPSIGTIRLHETSHSITNSSGLGINMQGVVRSSLGYNHQRYYAGIFYLTQLVSNELPIDGVWNIFSTGNFRLNLVYRFKLKKPIKVLLPEYW